MSGTLADRNAAGTWTVAGGIELTDGLTDIKLACATDWGSTTGSKIGCTYLNPELAVSGIESVAAGVTDVFVNGTLQASTSGTEIDFTVPSGVKQLSITLDGVSTNGTSGYVVQLGDSGGVETASYISYYNTLSVSSNTSSNATAGFRLNASAVAANAYYGIVNLTLQDAATNHWICDSSTGRSTEGTVQRGSRALDSELTTVRITTAGGTDTFDAGSINIQYDNQELDLGSGVISGGVVQTVNVQDGSQISGTTASPIDNTIPQITEGNEVLSISITPKSVSNKLRIDVSLNVSHSLTLMWITSALFQDSNSDALSSAAVIIGGATRILPTHLTYWMDAGTTDSTTFTVRCGGTTGATFYLNSAGATAEHGGVMHSSITITEYKV